MEALGSVKEEVSEEDEARQEEISQARRHMQLQCGRYALEILSGATFRTHCIGALVAGERIQPLYYDRSVIIVCKPIDMFQRDASSQDTDVTDAFVAMLVGLGAPYFQAAGAFKKNSTKTGLSKGAWTDTVTQGHLYWSEARVDWRGGSNIEVTLDRIISRHPGIVGRDTCVVEAASEHKKWKGKQLIVKISWPDISRTPEADFVEKAREKARTMTQGKRPVWALDHLPDILLSQDFGYDADSTQANLVTFFAKAMFAGEKLEYEGRVCRITVQERLHPLDKLQTAQEFAQVFFDILQSAYIVCFLLLLVISDDCHSPQMALRSSTNSAPGYQYRQYYVASYRQRSSTWGSSTISTCPPSVMTPVFPGFSAPELYPTWRMNCSMTTRTKIHLSTSIDMT